MEEKQHTGEIKGIPFKLSKEGCMDSWKDQEHFEIRRTGT